MASGPLATALLRVEDMRQAEAHTIAAGRSGAALMMAAGVVVADAVVARWSPCRTVVLCGPGNNGGDGFVVAQRLAVCGFDVSVALLGLRGHLSGDAAEMAGHWRGPTIELAIDLAPQMLANAELIVDALFGAGLSRPLEASVQAAFKMIQENWPVTVAVDLPSGVHGDSGAVLGAALACDLTVTFSRRKPGHLLLPGRQLCGEIMVADIGIAETAFHDLDLSVFANEPPLWREAFPRPAVDAHKGNRGHALVLGGAHLTGAGRLAARAARRVGAGLLTIACPQSAALVFALDQPGAMVQPLASAEDWQSMVANQRYTAFLLGPGAGLSAALADQVLQALAAAKHVVLDADALTIFADRPGDLFAALKWPATVWGAGCCAVLTPHGGEFRRLFEVSASKIECTRRAAELSGAVVVYKGPDTVIAAPDGRVAINVNAPAILATAGTGDVLAGMVLGLRAQGMPSFEAASAAVWLHGAAAQQFGPGLIAEDLPELLPTVLASLNLDFDGHDGHAT